MTTRRAALGASTAVLAGCALAATAFVTPAAAVVSTPNFIEPTAGETQINLIGINDFHGRILGADTFAATVLTAQQGFETNTLTFSNGDHVGASLFESSIQNDQPTIDILNTIGLDAYTQGNHEFDKGAADAIDRIAPATNGPDLAANVVAADGSKPFDEFATFDVNGVTVAIVGAVTQETPGLVSSDGIAGYTFTDPVAAVNDVASRLTDGDASNGEADVIIASYHEGAASSNVPLEENLSSEVFANIVNETSPAVSAIFNGHSHRTYAYDAPIPGTDQTRPVVQAGEYAQNIAQVVLTLDADNTVTLAESSIVPTFSAIPEAMAADPTVVAVQSLIADAKAEADVLGQAPVGLANNDITRAKQVDASGEVTVADDRTNASALGDMIATSMVDSVAATGREVDLAVMNPGGIRADLMRSEDGTITYKDAATILPFANNLSVATVTGETLKMILEQQWQRTADGDVPSRPYLQLGLSDGFTYTYDSTRTEGDRITGMFLTGTPIAADETYNIVAPTFLAAGGDNFHAFRDARNVADTGLIDLDAFVNWISAQTEANGGLTADTMRNGIEMIGYDPAAVFTCGDTTTVQLNNVNLGSLGAVENTDVVATSFVVDTADGEEGEVELGRATITDGAATLELAIPETFATGKFDVLLEMQPGAAYAVMQLQVECAGNNAGAGASADGGSGAQGAADGAADGDGDGSQSPTPTVIAGDDDLASTGADSAALFGAIAAGLAALVLGGAVLALRARRSAVE